MLHVIIIFVFGDIMDNKNFINKYVKENLSLQDKENLLFEQIKLLNQECIILFNKITDLNKYEVDYEEIKSIYNKLLELLIIYKSLCDSNNDIQIEEASNYRSIKQNFLFKIFLSLNVTFFSLSANYLLGILSLIILNKKAINDFTDDYIQLEKMIYENDLDGNLETIKTTLCNCLVLFNGYLKNNNLDITILLNKNDVIVRKLS